MTDRENVLSELRSLSEFGIPVSLMPPATREELDGILWDEVPDDYKEFLVLANGAKAPGLYLRGTTLQTIAGGHVEPDIIMATMDARNRQGLDENILVLGYLSGGLLLVYNMSELNYQQLDESTNLEVLFEFSSLHELVFEWAERKRNILRKTQKKR